MSVIWWAEVWAAVPELGPLCMNIKCVCGICVWGLKLEITSLTNQLWASLSVCLCTRWKEGVDWERERERNRADCDGVCLFYKQKLQKLGAVKGNKPLERGHGKGRLWERGQYETLENLSYATLHDKSDLERSGSLNWTENVLVIFSWYLNKLSVTGLVLSKPKQPNQALFVPWCWSTTVSVNSGFDPEFMERMHTNVWQQPITCLETVNGETVIHFSRECQRGSFFSSAEG